jgi:hypothetical protein
MKAFHSPPHPHHLTLGINITKEVDIVDNENYKTLMKEIKEDVKRWEDWMFMD